MLASGAMNTRLASLMLVAATAGGVMSCGGGAGGKVLNETMQYDAKTKQWTPLLEYKAPDVDEISGVDSEEAEKRRSEPPAGGK